MPYTEQDLEIIQSSIKEGVLEVQYADKRVMYRSLQEMLYIEKLIKQELGLASKRVSRNPSYSKGLK